MRWPNAGRVWIEDELLTRKSPASATPTEPVIRLEDVSMSYSTESDKPLSVLEHINVSLKDGEILGLLGRSGSGKSTLLRIASGLVKPTSGRATYLGKTVDGPGRGVAMVFQTFALVPWLTVRQNVEAGLDALGVRPHDAADRAVAAIETIGLKGFEDAYPRQLSGGMRQRVGFARATVVQPTVLLMDEPFSALDVLTAENLRTDFIDLWAAGRLPTRAVLMVTHNIEEAVLMCDRIVVLSSDPGRISLELDIDLPQPRNRMDSAFREVVDEIYSALTTRTVDSIRANRNQNGGLAQPLPAVTAHQIEALCETLVRDHQGAAAITALTRELHIGRAELMSVAQCLHILEFAEIKGADLNLTAAGRIFAEADEAARKVLFAEHLVRFVPAAAHLLRVLKERPGHSAPTARFRAELEDHMQYAAAQQTLHSLVTWSCYAGILDYSYKRRTVSLPAAVA